MDNFSPRYGRSGCRFERPDGKTIVKYSSKLEYNDRILLQANKQKNFKPLGRIVAPEVYHIYDGNGKELSSFSMEYIDGESMLEWLVKHSDNVEWFIANIFDYIDLSMSLAVNSDVDRFPIEQKMRNISSENIWYPPIPNDKLLCGKCHGDLTLSNMIYHNFKIYLLDFLDTYPQTPLYDIVKLREDTKYMWSLFLSNNNSPQVRKVMEYIDSKIVEKYRDVINTKWYEFLNHYSLMRIIPYIKSDSELQYILQVLL